MNDPRLNNVSSGEILIVEDNQASLLLLTEVLENAGYSVRQAQDGQMALATVRNRPPDLILLDISMPNIDGYDVCRQLKAKPLTQNIPIIFCSALHDTDYKIQAFARGAVDFVTKPYHPEEILVRVRTHIELARLRAGLERRVRARTSELESVANSLREEIKSREKVEADLRLSSKVFEASFSGIMVTDDKGVIVAVNPAFSRITGYSREEAIGATPRILQSDRHDEEFYQQQMQSLSVHGMWTGEIWNRRKDGNVVPMMETIHEFKDENGQVSHYIATLADISEIKDAQTLIDFLVNRDTLTGLANRLVARKHFEQEVIIADRNRSKLALYYLDLDRFKVINDSLGHGIGDQVLKQLSTKLSNSIAQGDLLSREGGDEFLIIASQIKTPDDVLKQVKLIAEEFNQIFVIDQHSLSVTTSIGVALYPDDGRTFDDLLKAAENALYNCKKKGGNDYCLFTTRMNAEARLRMELENCLRGAISNDELQLVYQPKLSAQTGKITGAEALVRWNSPVLGFVSPANFIPLAEETGLILAIDEWVITTACKQIRRWIDKGKGANKVSVNLSTLQFRRGDLIALIQRVLAESGIEASSLDLEITEGVLMDNMQTAIPILDSLKQLGVSISLDDFGTGYSSLSYLKRLPIDTLKIDKSFVDEIHMQSSDAMIARTVISLGHNLGLNVVAEGVEHQQQYEFLREHGCDEIQGYYFSKPLPPTDFESLLNTMQPISNITSINK
jgi:diguanylate cyclase (GGDEF)-like protein/PAS domain S-box-containing protein